MTPPPLLFRHTNGNKIDAWSLWRKNSPLANLEIYKILQEVAG